MKIAEQIPNILSIIRIIGSFLILLVAENPIVFVALLFCGITDILDGYIARRFQYETKIGTYLDSFADFTFYWIIVFYLINHRIEIITENIYLLGAIIIIRLFSLFICWIRNRKIYILHTIGNKVSGFIVFILIGISILLPKTSLIPIGLVFILFSAIEENIIMILIKSPDSNTKSILLQ